MKRCEIWYVCRLSPYRHTSFDCSKPATEVLHKSYRPTSILSSFSNILEKLISLQLVHCFDSNAILNRSQFGFRVNRSTELACHMDL